jgi:hypothetical protein
VVVEDVTLIQLFAQMDAHTTMLAQILSQFQQGRNGH